MNYDNLLVWQKSKKLAVEIIKTFRSTNDYEMRKQVIRAGISIPSNIAEGYERESNKELIRFLYIAKGSAGELKTQLIISKEANIIDIAKADKLISEAEEISYMLNALIKKRKTYK